MKSRYRIRQNEVTPYSPANHTGTKNFRLIGGETVGAKQLEVLVGEIERGKGALPHAHPASSRCATCSKAKRMSKLTVKVSR